MDETNDRRRRHRQRMFLGLLTLVLSGCRRNDGGSRRAEPMPPRTLLFSVLLEDLRDQPGFTDQLMGVFGKSPRTGPGLMTPLLLERLTFQIANMQWEDVDRFPGLTVWQLNPVVSAVQNIVRAKAGPLTASGMATLTKYVDVGTYGFETAQTVDLNRPSALPGLTAEGTTKALLYQVVEGDAPNPANAPLHSESARLAQVMTRLAMNGLDGVAPVQAKVGDITTSSPEGLVRALSASGHRIEVADARFFANFGHLHYEEYDVMMPFWVNAEVYVPGTERQLLVPVAHAEYEWRVRGPKINADVAFYYGIDGKAQFRTMDTLDQAWVMGRHAHEYRDAQAAEVTRLAGLLALAYARQHLARPGLAFGGYYTLGVCQDGVSAIEQKMTGTTTLYPNTAQAELFNDPRDGEINALMASIPNDRNGSAPEMQRVFGSLPTENLEQVSIPHLAADLISVHRAWLDGTLGQTPKDTSRRPVLLGVVLGALLAAWWLMRWRRNARDKALRDQGY